MNGKEYLRPGSARVPTKKPNKNLCASVKVVTGAQIVNSPCHDLPGEQIVLTKTKSYEEFTVVCPRCKKEFSNMIFKF